MKSKYRMKYHLMPPQGWLNDPNGLCQFHGVYHVFFQYAPFDVNGGMKFWGHYTSLDMVEWKYEGIALTPDSKEDRSGVYSGSAWIEKDKMYLYYTGNVKLEGKFDYIDEGREAYQLLVTSDDGIQMSEKNCLLTPEDYPEGYTTHVRDPKIFKKNSTYFMALGARKKAEKGNVRVDKGAILIYRSEDLRKWEFLREITSADNFGYMWECPDIFEINAHTVLSFSPQGLVSEKYRFQNVYQSGYVFLRDDIDGECPTEQFREWDMGFDFYAPQTFKDDSGRQILIGWAGMPDSESEYVNVTVEEGWQHCLTVPRELELKNGIVYQWPVQELQNKRKKEVHLRYGKEMCISETAFDLEIEGITGNTCSLRIGSSMKKEDYLEIKAVADTVSIRFTGMMGAGRGVRKAKVIDTVRNIRILYDVSIAEIYINDGELVFTTRMYPEGKKIYITVEANADKSVVWSV